MTQLDLHRAIHSLVNFAPPEGVSFAIVLRPAPGICRVAVALSAIEGETDYVELTEPLSEEGLRALYRRAETILDAAWDSEIVPGPSWAAGLGLDLSKIGGDQ